MDERIRVLGDYYPLEDILEQNDIEAWKVIQWLVDEEMIDLEDYFFDEKEEEDDGA